MSNIQKQYNALFHDPSLWVMTAEKHILSAKLLDQRIQKVIHDLNGIDDDDYAFELESLRGSTLLLVGLALENVIKGYIVLKNPECKDEKELMQVGWRKDHKIIEMYKKYQNDIYKNRIPYFERIQENLIWMGKYGLPNPNYIENLLRERDYWSDDVPNAENIVKNIATIVYEL